MGSIGAVSAAELVASAVSAFFVIGIAVGVIGVIALGAVRGHRRAVGQAGACHAPAEEEDDGPPCWPGR
jgi:hypothetical protein